MPSNPDAEMTTEDGKQLIVIMRALEMVSRDSYPVGEIFIFREDARILLARISSLTATVGRLTARLRACQCPYCPYGCGRLAQEESEPACCCHCENGENATRVGLSDVLTEVG